MTNEELLTRIETLLDDRFGVVHRQFEIIDGKFKTVDDQFKTMNDRFRTIDDQFKIMNDRFGTIDDQFKTVNDKFKGIDNQFKTVNDRFDEFSSRFDELRAEILCTRDILEARIATLEVRFDNLENRFDNLENRFDRLENRVEAVRVELKKEIRDTRDHLEAEIGRSFSAIIETHREVKLTRRRVREIEHETLTRIEQLEQRVERLEAELPPQG